MSEKRLPFDTGPCLKRYPSGHLRGSVDVIAPPLGVQTGGAPRAAPGSVNVIARDTSKY